MKQNIDYAKLEAEFQQAQLFLSTGAAQPAAAAGHRNPSDAVNPILQKVVYGEESAVKAALDAIKNNPAQLISLLSNTGTVKDYSDRTITGMTLLQAAAAAGDIDMCLMLKNYIAPKEFVNQLAEIFPEGIEAHEIDQQRNAFNFDAILAAISAANTLDLDAALNKQDNVSKLCAALEGFRRQFSGLSNRERIFNPQHLLCAFEVYDALWDQCERDGSDRNYKKRDLFWRQIIGYTQRFMPACYAQALSQGLYYLVKVGQPDSCRLEAVRRDLKLRDYTFSYFPLDSCPGLGFDFAIYWSGSAGGGVHWHSLNRNIRHHIFSKTFVEQKTAGLQNIMSLNRQSHSQSDKPSPLAVSKEKMVHTTQDIPLQAKQLPDKAIAEPQPVVSKVILHNTPGLFSNVKKSTPTAAAEAIALNPEDLDDILNSPREASHSIVSTAPTARAAADVASNIGNILDSLHVPNHRLANAALSARAAADVASNLSNIMDSLHVPNHRVANAAASVKASRYAVVHDDEFENISESTRLLS